MQNASTSIITKNPKNLKLTLAAILGTVTEYFDYSLYGFSSKSIAESFFSNLSEKLSLVITLGVFAIGYLSKPLGGLLFGYISDHYGRKISLQITIIGIAIPTFAIGIMPTYHEIGYLAPILVTLCRFLQGVFVGGEYDSAAVFLLEHNGKNKSGYSSSIIRASGMLGLFIGAFIITIFTKIDASFWRIPFLFSLPFMLITLYLRNFLEETPEFKNQQINQKTKVTFKASILSLFKENGKNILVMACYFGAISGGLQFLIVFLKTFAPILNIISEFQQNLLHILNILLAGLTMLFTAFFIDRFNKVKIFYFSFLTSLIFALLLFFSISMKNVNLFILSQILLSISLAPPSALMHGFIYQLFSVSNRVKGISISHNLGSLLFSGSTPFLAFAFYTLSNEITYPVYFFIFLILLGIFSFTYLLKLVSNEVGNKS